MKTKVKRLSKRSLAVFLGVLMLVTSIGIGSLITAEADTYYLWWSDNGGTYSSFTPTNSVAMTQNDSDYVGSFTQSGNGSFYFAINTSSSDFSSGNVITSGFSGITVTNGNSSIFNEAGAQLCWNGTKNVYSVRTSMKNGSTRTIYVTYNPSTATITFSDTDPGGGSTPDPTPTPDPGGDSNGLGTKVDSSSNLYKILNGTDVAIYIVSYKNNNNNKYALTNNSASDYKAGTCINKDNGTEGIGWIQTAKANLSTYNYITNNYGSWKGVQNNNITNSIGGGGLYRANATVDKTDATSGSSTIGSTFKRGNKAVVSTTVNKQTMSYSSDTLKLYYYVKSGSDFYPVDGQTNVAVTAANTAQTFDLDTTGFEAGSYTLYTVAKADDRDLYYILDTDNFAVTEIDTESTVSNMLIFNLNNKVQSAWSWGGSSNNDRWRSYTYKSEYNSTYLSYFNNSTDGYTSAIPSKTSLTDNSSGWDTGRSGRLTGNVTGGSASSDGVRYYYNTSTSEGSTENGGTWIPFVHISDTISLSSSNVPAGADITITDTPSGTLYTDAGNAADVHYYAIKKDDNSQIDLGTEKTFHIDTVGTYYIVGYVSDKWGLEKTMTNVEALNVKTAYTVSATTSTKAKYGSIEANKTKAIADEEVTITIKEQIGEFSSISAHDALGNTVALSGSGNTRTFTMPASNVTVTAAFTAYEGTSDFYYNGYNSSGDVGTYYASQMSLGKVGGQVYSYFHVTGRSENDQLFTISYGNPTANGTVYFCTPLGWNQTHGWDSDPDAQFYSSDGKVLKTWKGMSYDGKYGDVDKCWSISVPWGARYVQFRGTANDPDTSNWPATALFDLNDLADNKDCIYISQYGKNGDGQFDKLGAKNRGNTTKPIYDGFYENFKDTNKYTSAFSTGGFNAVTKSGHSFPAPDGLTASTKGDYYILVLYKDVTYTINNDTITIGNDPEVIWSPTLPGLEDFIEEDFVSIDLYAKDGAVTMSDKGFAAIATTTLESGYDTAPIQHTGANNQDYYTSTVELNDDGSTRHLIVKTVIDSDYKSRYFVKGWCVNGETIGYNVDDSIDETNGTYTVDIPLTYEKYKDAKTIEITPIYYTKDQSKTISFRVEGFDKKVQDADWGNTLYVYPFYGSLSNVQNSFGAYPGQPMIYYQGKYFIQIPIESISITDPNTDDTLVRGITLNNGYEDTVHKEINGWDSREKHKQTYDFDDFYKIYKEKNANDIIFRFKYRATDKVYNNDTYYNDSSLSSEEITNIRNDKGWELLKDRAGRIIDIFGDPITDNSGHYITDDSAINSANALRIISMGYFDNNSGQYATEWNIYKKGSGSSYDIINSNGVSVTVGGKTYAGSTAKHSIVPSALLMNSTASFTTYTTYRDKPISFYLPIYQKLNNTSVAKGIPAYIDYEKDQVRSNNAVRCDGRWYYTTANDLVQSKIKIQYQSENEDILWTDDSYSTSNITDVTGEETGAQAYFTNTAYNKKRQSTAEIYSAEASDNYKFTCKSSDNYAFVGWFYEYDSGTDHVNYAPISTDVSAQASRTSNDTIVARFKEVTSGTLKISHKVDTTWRTPAGTGDTFLSVDVINSTGAVVKSFDETSDDITIGNTYIKASRTNWKIRVTLRTEEAADNTFNTFTSSASGALFPQVTDGEISSKTKVITFNYTDFWPEGEDQTTKSITYYSRLTPISHDYTIRYSYNSKKLGVNQKYTVSGTFDEDTYSSYVTVDGGNRTVNTSFIKEVAPYESNFKEILSVEAASITQEYTVNGAGTVGTHTINVSFVPRANKNITGVFHLPYQYNKSSSASYNAASETYKVYGESYTADDTIQTASGILEDYSSEKFNVYTVYGGHFVKGDNPADKVFENETAVFSNMSNVITAPEEILESEEETVTKYTYYKVNDEKVKWKDLEGDNYDRALDNAISAYLSDKNVTSCTDEEAKEYYTYNNYVLYRISNETHYKPTGDKKYFKYWKIENSNGEEVARCFNKSFSYLGFENYDITPIYSKESVDINSNPYASISYLEESRNQWNNNGSGGFSGCPDTDVKAADYIFVDFAINFEYMNKQLNRYDGGDLEIGILMQKAGARGSMTTQSDFKSAFADTVETQRANALAYLNDSSSNPNKFKKTIIAKSQLNNKNRANYCANIVNTYGWNDSTNSPNTNVATYKDNVFRVFSYIQIEGKTYVSEKPAYFCTYVTANRKGV